VSQQQVDNAASQLETARSQFIAAEKRLQTLEQDIQARLTSARARVQEAEASLRSAEANRNQVELAQQALEEARAQYQQAVAALEQARSNLRQIRLREADIATAKAQRARAEAQLYNAQVQLDSTTIVAPRDGVVISRNVEEGTIVPPGTSLFSQGTTLLQIADTARMYVEVSVDEADIGLVRVGQSVLIRIDAFPDKPFRGKVSRIDPQAVLEQNVTVVKVRVEVLTPDERLKPGLNATCEFLVARKASVLAVPNEAVQESPEGHYVEVLVQGRPQRRPVKVGIQGNELTEIVEGLHEGETVVAGRIFPSWVNRVLAPPSAAHSDRGVHRRAQPQAVRHRVGRHPSVDPVACPPGGELSMSLIESLISALESLRANKMRTLLTMLGVIIGVGAVIAMIGIAQGARAYTLEQIQKLGANVLTVRAGQARRAGRFSASAACRQ
jgi:HlyD family secretion protein